MKKLYVLLLLIIVCKLAYGQGTSPVTDPEPIVKDQVYAVHSLRYDDYTLDWTVSIFLFKGTNDTVWVFGMGFGGTADINFYYNNGKTYTSSGANNDAHQVGNIVENNFGISKTDAKLQFVVPHFHLDHVNQEFITALSAQNFDLDNSRIFVHTNDYTGSTCGKPCCGQPCNETSEYLWAPYNQAWTAETLQKFEVIGKPDDQCDDYLMSFDTSYGMWKILKARGHTSGAVNLSNEALKLTILGGERCPTPGDWQVVGPHGDINMDQIVLSANSFKLTDQMKVFPVPSDGQITIQIEHPGNHGELVIYNSVGTRILSTTNISKQFNTTLPRGFYLANYTDYQEKVKSVTKIIVE